MRFVLLLSETNGGAGWSALSARDFSVQAAEGQPCAALLALSRALFGRCRALFGRCSLSLIQLCVYVCVFYLFSFSFSLFFFVVSDGASPAGSECIAAVGGGASSSVTAPNESKRSKNMVERLSVTEKQFGYAGVRDGRHTKAAHIKVNVEKGVRCRRLLLQGTRNHVLYLAQHHPKPKGNPGAKEGMWVPQRFLYGYYSDDLQLPRSSIRAPSR